MTSPKARFEREVGGNDWFTHPGTVMRIARAAFVAGWAARFFVQAQGITDEKTRRGVSALVRRQAIRAWECGVRRREIGNERICRRSSGRV